jgi:hypothetical protein
MDFYWLFFASKSNNSSIILYLKKEILRVSLPTQGKNVQKLFGRNEIREKQDPNCS